jgi:hypothetical protein
VVLELDRIRTVITPQPTYGDAEREAVYRALVYIAADPTCRSRSLPSSRWAAGW